jgi:uncharacterized phage protein (TIGR02216 family)
MTAGLGTLRLAPHDFWSMTPRELDAALRGALGLVAATPGDDAFRSEGANGGISGCELKSSSPREEVMRRAAEIALWAVGDTSLAKSTKTK